MFRWLRLETNTAYADQRWNLYGTFRGIVNVATRDPYKLSLSNINELFGGARRNRTDDLFNAIEALSQLSYGPMFKKSLSSDWAEPPHFPRAAV